MVNKILLFLLCAFLVLSENSHCQVSIEVYATGLTNPIGLTIDGNGNLWVAEQGTGNNDSRISIVTQAGVVHPFIINLPSAIIQGDPIGAEHVLFDIDGKLLIVQGEGNKPSSESILVVDTSGFTPGDPPLTPIAIEAVYNIGDYSLSQGGQTTNPYRIVIGPNDDWYISDAGFNGVIKRERSSGTLSVFTNLGNVVSTGIVYTITNFYVGSLSTFPFPTGGAAIYDVDLNGNKSIYQGQLTTITDVAMDPIDNKLVAIQFGEFNGGFLQTTGALFKIYNSNVDTLIYGLDFPAGMVFNSAGELFISTLEDGEILKITGIPLDVENELKPLPDNFTLAQNYPNPFNPATTIKYSIAKQSNVTLKVYDVLGNEIATLVDEEKSTGVYEINFNASNLASGIYFYKIQAGNFVETKKMILLR